MLSQSRPARLVTLAVGALLLTGVVFAATATAQTTGTQVSEPGSFTSNFSVAADASQVPEQDDGSRGEPRATGTSTLRLNSDDDIICHDITLRGVTPPFESPAPTATHIHDGPAGMAGPAVWLFPNPEMGADGTLRTTGCLQGAFTADGNGMGFAVADIEAGPTGYYVDNHTGSFAPGAVRGQFGPAMPVGGVATGAGGTATGTSPLVVAGLLGLTVLAGATLGVGSLRRRRHDATAH